MTIEEIFKQAENGMLTYEQFTAKATGAKFVDLTEGNYVSKQKYNDDLASRDTRITEMTNTISTRDTDLRALKKQLEEASTGDVEKINSITADLTNLQAKYRNDTKALQEKLDKQAYEFAVRDFSNSKKFSSNAAKRDFERSLIAKNLQMENGKILGAEDFVTAYSQENADAFVVETPPAPETPKPMFVAPLQNATPPTDSTSGFANAFHFAGVRPKPTE